MSRRLSALTLGVLVLALSACAGIPEDGTGTFGAGPDTTVAPATTGATEETESPDTTEAPDTTAGGGEAEEDALGANVIWVAVGVVLVLILLGWLMGRGRRPTPPVAPVAPGWRDHLRDGYSHARWLADGLTEDLAIWRGNTLTEQPSDGASELADRWTRLDERMGAARDSLYKAEASAPDSDTVASIRETVAALNATRSSLDDRAQARSNAAARPDDPDLAEQERIASTNLAEARARLNESLASISGLT